MPHTCYECNEKLSLNATLGQYECTNPRCSACGAVARCEVCQELSIGSTPRRCLNPTCPAHNTRRDGCGSCGRETQIVLSKVLVCLNESCARNASLPACSFCGWDSLSRADYKTLLVTCRRRDCRAGLKLIRNCPVCGKLTFDLHQARCLDKDCLTVGVRVSHCPSCSKKRYFGSKPGEKKCANPDCELFIGIANGVAPARMQTSSDRLRGSTALPAASAVRPDTRSRDQRGLAPSVIIEPGDGGPGTQIDQPLVDKLAQASASMRGDTGQVVMRDGVASPAELMTIGDRDGWEDERDRDTQVRVREGSGVHERGAAISTRGVGRQSSGEITRTSIIASRDELQATQDRNGEALPDLDDDSTTGNVAIADDLIELEAGEVDFPAAFRYLQRTVLKPDGTKRSPLYLVVGLSGVGKTCYLTLLGQVLQGRSFYTPRPDIAPQMVQIESRYRPFLRDLVFNYSNPRWQEYISQGNWPPPDIPDQSHHFLVTELLKEGGDLAKLVTLEISGEVYQSLLYEIPRIYQDPAHVDELGETQRIIWDMMQMAEGMTILLDITMGLGLHDERDSSRVYFDLFQALAQWKEAVVRRILHDQYARFLKRDKSKDPLAIQFIINQMQQTAAPVSFEQFATEMSEKAKPCLQTLKDYGVLAVFQRHLRAFNELRTFYVTVRPEDRAMTRLMELLGQIDTLKNPSQALGAFQVFVSTFFEQFSDNDFLAKAYERLTAEVSAPTLDQWQIFLRYISWYYNLDEEGALQLLDDKNLATGGDKNGKRPFRDLRQLAIVFTKTDKHHAVYPASNFPRVVAPEWTRILGRLSNYLTLSNGYLKYYNASVTGYSVRKDANFQIGRRGTLTPINIAEPILDMLTFRGQPPLDFPPAK